MAEQEEEIVELPLATAGQKLREARQAAGLTVADISSRTKIARRHISAIEDDRFADLVSRTYAIGFSRSYARTLDLDENAIADQVRAQLESDENTRHAPQTEHFEPGDPARVPPSMLAWGAAGAALIAILVLFLFWGSFVDPAGSIPDFDDGEPVVAAQTGNPAPTGQESPGIPSQPAGPVVLTALADRIWVKIVNADGDQIFQKEMTLGDTFTLPSDARGPLLSTARPDALGISIGGRPVPKLADAPVVLRDVPVDPGSLAAPRPGALATGQPSASPTTQTSTVSE